MIIVHYFIRGDSLVYISPAIQVFGPSPSYYVTVSYSSSSSLSSDGKSFFVFDTFYKFAVLLLLFGLVMRARWAGLAAVIRFFFFFSPNWNIKRKEKITELFGPPSLHVAFLLRLLNSTENIFIFKLKRDDDIHSSLSLYI